MSRLKIERRTFLRGALGSALALPLLEAMEPFSRASAATGPARLLYAFGGMALGWDLDNTLPTITSGSGWSNTTGLKPIYDAGLEAEATLVSGMLIPDGSGLAHRDSSNSLDFHGTRMDIPLATGRSSNAARGPSVEFLMAEQQALGTSLNPLSYRVQAESYIGSGETDLSISYRRNSGGTVERFVPIFSPVLAYQRFTSYTTATSDELQQRMYDASKGKSVLDLVNQNATRLRERLGNADRQRLEQYFQELRDYEQRLLNGALAGACNQIAGFPTQDPGVTSVPTDPGGFTGYTGEAERAALFTQLIKLAFQCDVARAASLLVTAPQTFVSATFLPLNETMSIHNMSHTNSPEMMQKAAMSVAYAWHVGLLVEVAKGLKAQTDPDGVPMLDRTVMVLTLEGGTDPSLGDNQSPHCTKNMVMLVLGGKGLGLQQGRHIVAQDKHPSQVILSAMRAAGYTGAFGEVQQGLPELLV